MKLSVVALAAGLLWGCAGGNPLQSPAQAVFAAESSYAGALTLAVAYKRLPVCLPAHEAGYLCSKQEVVVRLQKADDAAFALLEGAQNTVRAGGGNLGMAVTAAQQAVSAFVSITSTLKVK